ncbi:MULTISPECIES: type IX secretion system outer membrane channel protein PorV [unclassified Polaribacter]|uniref:type IX secretion system outer membrane channel protein PorV n=1 Tax=unclassified Polaribacter TaxID=196858 RepID=UPI0011BF6638|nr:MULTISPECIES: type IX secretion system outer membrane channel protein PorV [unclassified Polaribacter]TXD51289.1 type IX secretion system outer membrane channel protein PorV [Polaribacter sp. IC063]TXD58042.1 type IX secretion system outer membrane channel protein PorV [Polaribacter sp. IC066]
MKKIGFCLALCAFVSLKINAQVNSITTATPFLLIVPDARAGGMGDMGVATSADGFSLFHNPAKIAFSDRQIKTGITYSPWLRNLTDDIFVGSGSYINRYSENAAWGADFKYFSLGQIDLTDNQGNPLGTINPNEFVATGSYALKLSETFSMGVSLKYIRSNLAFNNTAGNTLQPINSFAVDVSGYYQSYEENYGNFNGRYRVGFNISNIGPKVSYTPGEEDFIPTNLKFGGGFDFILDDYNIISTNVEFTKLLVPTPQPDGSDEDKGFIQGIFGSFGDAPGGFSEELSEVTYALGAEYLYNNAFALRGGYFHESVDKGNRQYFTLGAGFKTNALNIDLSYLINSSDVNNPLENSLRFSVSFDLGEIYDNY